MDKSKRSTSLNQSVTKNKNNSIINNSNYKQNIIDRLKQSNNEKEYRIFESLECDEEDSKILNSKHKNNEIQITNPLNQINNIKNISREKLQSYVNDISPKK